MAVCNAAIAWDLAGQVPAAYIEIKLTAASCSKQVSCSVGKRHFFANHACLLALGSGTYSPECISIRVPVLAAGIPTVPMPGEGS